MKRNQLEGGNFYLVHQRRKLIERHVSQLLDSSEQFSRSEGGVCGGRVDPQLQIKLNHLIVAR